MKLFVLYCGCNNSQLQTRSCNSLLNYFAMYSKIHLKNEPQKFISFGFIFKISLFLLFVYFFLSKDINFQVNFNSPFAQETENQNQVEEVVPVQGIENPIEPTSKFSSLTSFFSQKKEKKQTKSIYLDEISEEDIQKYIKRFSNVAISERRKFGIPASITLANSLLQSVAGHSEMAEKANNHFHVPCNGNWDGMMIDINQKCYRKYESAWAGFRGHSRYISTEFSSLKAIGTTDYKAWAKGLQQMKYNQDKNLGQKLIQLVEKYDLDQFDA